MTYVDSVSVAHFREEQSSLRFALFSGELKLSSRQKSETRMTASVLDESNTSSK